mmetsp:Transcript_21945/g.33356  ORF Transcript_21945/g.33356 Transcript_21945/m.33356 type:complete len:104 (-) Transcript_21945:646-957(-)
MAIECKVNSTTIHLAATATYPSIHSSEFTHSLPLIIVSYIPYTHSSKSISKPNYSSTHHHRLNPFDSESGQQSNHKVQGYPQRPESKQFLQTRHHLIHFPHHH